MNITADMAMVVTILLAFIRVSALFLLSPLFSIAQVPINVRVILLLSLASMMVLSMGIYPSDYQFTLSSLLFAAVQELFIGLIMAFTVFAAFAAFLFGGRILDFQMGFGVANLIDPATNAQGPLIGTILNMMAVVTFFMLNGHHMMIRGLAYSFEKIPVGQNLTELPLDVMVGQFGMIFVYGLMLVAPAVFTILLLDVGLAIAARTMPQVNIFIVGLPLKIFVGLVILAISLNYLSPLLERIFESVFRSWEYILV